jgi:hypothetical protein
LDVLREIGFAAEQWEVARLSGFDIQIRPRATLVRSGQHCVYGILATGTHTELSDLYAHSRDVLGQVYLPEAVLTETLDGKSRPALCYICPAMDPQPTASDYLDKIVMPARKYGFPEWYVERLEAFRS